MKRIAVTAAVTLAALALLLTPTAPAAVGHSTLAIPCGSGVTVQADWFKPSGQPSGLVWMLHGYLSSKADIAALAQTVSSRTGALVVSATVSSNSADPAGCWIGGAPFEQAVASLFTGGREALTASARAAGWTAPLPGPTVLAGHSAGGNLALAVAGYLNGAGDIRAVVMLDGAFGSDPSQAAAALTAVSPDLPVLQIASARGAACNTTPVVTDVLVAARPGRFVGVTLEGGNHLDSIGYANFFGNLLCGWPRLENVMAVQTITSDWVRNALTGTAYGITGGTPGQPIPVGAATAVVLG